MNLDKLVFHAVLQTDPLKSQVFLNHDHAKKNLAGHSLQQNSSLPIASRRRRRYNLPRPTPDELTERGAVW